MFDFIAGVIVIILSFIVGMFDSRTHTSGGSKAMSVSAHSWQPPAVATTWFDPKTFVTESGWHIGQGSDPAAVSRWEPVDRARWASQLQLHDREGVSLSNDRWVMRWRTFAELPDERETRWLRECRVTLETLATGGAFLMTPFLREWQRQNVWKWIADGSALLDIGIGTGRSRDMWERKRLRVWGVEPNESSIAALARRRLPEVQALEPWGGEDPRIQTWLTPQSIDVVEFVYSITFFSRSPETLEALMANLRHAVAPKGRVIIIGMDGDQVDSWFALESGPDKTSKHGKPGDELDNELFTIKRKYKTRRTFGSEIEITIKNPTTLVESQIEYLVDFDHMRRVMKKEGYKCVVDERVQPPEYLGKWTQRFIAAQRLLVFDRCSASGDLRSSSPP